MNSFQKLFSPYLYRQFFDVLNNTSIGQLIQKRLVSSIKQVYIGNHPAPIRSFYKPRIVVTQNQIKVIRIINLFFNSLFEKIIRNHSKSNYKLIWSNLNFENDLSLLFSIFDNNRIYQHQFENDTFYITSRSKNKSTTYLWHLNLNAYLSQLLKGWVVIHAAGVLRNGNLYIFLGQSGAGKSTICELCEKDGCFRLDEDQILLRKQSDGNFIGCGWGYQVITSLLPLKAIFIIHQDQDNKITSVSSLAAYKKLLQSFFQVPPIMGIEPFLMKQAASTLAQIARTIPAYNLHFTKSPDFWELIDAEFDD